MASKCRKFVPNIFNKTKCQNCFAAKDAHSAEALENNKASRKVSKCGYLFVAPDYDFSNPLDRQRRWQRRFFRLYDDGELTFSLDENPDTVPQGVIDMNKCIDVKDGEAATSHAMSMGVVTSEKTLYIKVTSKEEMMWWHDVLMDFPRNRTQPKKRRHFTVPSFSSNKENVQPGSGPVVASGVEPLGQGRFEVEKIKGKDGTPFATYRGVRSLKHKADKHYQEGLRKSSSLHDLSAEDKEVERDLVSSRFLSRSGDRLDYVTHEPMEVDPETANILADANNTSPYTPIPRRTWQTLAANTFHSPQPSSTAAHVEDDGVRRGSFDDKTLTGTKLRNASERSKLHRERSTSLKDFPRQLSLPRSDLSGESASMERLPSSQQGETQSQGQDTADGHSGQSRQGGVIYESRNNETDEHKMAKSSEMHASGRSSQPASPAKQPTSAASSTGVTPTTKYEDLMYMKKGWLIKQGMSEKDWKKHWFVLTGNSLRYYKDAKAEETNSLDGRIDLSTCYEISDVDIARNYGFRIKTRNGEYVLSAMTSGIRSNWMKAIRLCMDLQSSGLRRSPSNLSSDSAASLSPRTIDDLDLDSSAGLPSSRLASSMDGRLRHNSGKDSHRDSRRKEVPKNVRRHYSDVSPGNVSKMFSVTEIKDLTEKLETIHSPPQTQEVPSAAADQSEERPEEADVQGAVAKKTKYSAGQEPYWSSSSVPLRRYVEGSDNHSASGQHAEGGEENKKPTGGGEGRKEEEERKKRAKSPSARIKEKSRAKSPKLHSPPPEAEELAFRRTIPGTEAVKSDDLESVGSEDVDMGDLSLTQDQFHDAQLPPAGEDIISSPESTQEIEGTGNSTIVELLETEVESLKERLEQSQHEMANMHETNMDLKTRLQTVIREKDSAQQAHPSQDSSYMLGLWPQAGQGQGQDNGQIQAMKRQVTSAKETIQRQKGEIDGLKSKLEMSVSKLTGTEKALSESLRDLKQEKDRFTKMTNEGNRRIRNLETQVKDTTHKMERNRDTLLTKEKECRRLENEVKSSMQRVRDHEREILKLKAVEHEYKQMKERLDDTERQILALKSELKEKDAQVKKADQGYEHQMEEMEKEFIQERDSLETHLEELKKQLLEAQRKTSMSDSITNNMADILREKDEIISQLEEKVIENDRKTVELQEELQVEVDENMELQENSQHLQEERDGLQKRLAEMEKSFTQIQLQMQRMESDSASLRKHMEQLKQSNQEMADALEAEKQDSSKLQKDKSQLQVTVADLNTRLQGLKGTHREHSQGSGSSSVGRLDSGDIKEMIQNLIIVDSEVRDMSDTMLNLRKQFEEFLSKEQGEGRTQLVDMAEVLEDIGRKFESVRDILKEGIDQTLESGSEPKQKESVNNEALMAEYTDLKTKFHDGISEIKNLKQELTDVYANFEDLESQEKVLQEQMESYKGEYGSKLQMLVSRVDELSGKVCAAKSSKPRKSDKPAKSSKPTPKTEIPDPQVLSEEIEEQLCELEDRIGLMEKAVQDSSMNSQQTPSQDGESDDESESFFDSEEEDSEDEVKDTSNTSLSDSIGLVTKLKAMKTQLEMTNNKIKDITVGLSDQNTEQHSKGDDAAEDDLRRSLKMYGEKISKLTSRLSEQFEVFEGDASEMAVDYPDNAIAFQQSIRQVKQKLQEIQSEMHGKKEIDSKGLKTIQEKLRSLSVYLEHLNSMGNVDWEQLGKITKQKAMFQAQIAGNADFSKHRLSYEKKLQLYADRIAFESIILGQMAYLVQSHQFGSIYKDVLLREIQDVNHQILALERKIDSASNEGDASENPVDLVSSYAAMLSERIVLEGQLASCAMAAENQGTDDTAVLAALQVMENPSVLALEVFMRSQVDSSLNQFLQQSSEQLDNVSTSLATRTLVHGEITCALQDIKSRFGNHCSSEDMVDLLKRERKFAFEQLVEREKSLTHSVTVYQKEIFSELVNVASALHSKSIDWLCARISELFGKKIDEFKAKQRTGESGMQSKKWQHVINSLQTELGSTVSVIKTCKISSDISSEQMTSAEVFVETSLTEVSGILIQKAIICGLVVYIAEISNKVGTPERININRGDSANAEISEEGKALHHFAQNLGQSLLCEATSKQALSAELKKRTSERGDNSSQPIEIISDLVDAIPDLDQYPHTFCAYSEVLVREAVYQAQLTYLTYKQKLHHEHELRDMKLQFEAGKKVEIPGDGGKESEHDSQKVLSVFEEILETKFEDECEVLSMLEKDINLLKSVQINNTCSCCKEFEQQLRNLDQSLQHEELVAQERHDVHLDVLQQEVSKVTIHMDRLVDEWQKDKENIVAEYEDRIMTLQDDIECMQASHEEELEQVRQDIMTAVSAIRANEEPPELSDHVRQLQGQLVSQKKQFQSILAEIQSLLPKSELSGSLGQQVIAHMEQLEQENLNSQELQVPLSPLSPLSPVSPPDSPPGIPVEEEVESAPISSPPPVEKQKEAAVSLLELSQHEHELSILKREKEEALAEEMRTTKAALDAMRKAYEEDLEQEKDRYRDALKTMYTDEYVEEIRLQHEREVDRLNGELKQVSMHYDSKCEDYKLLEDRMQRTKSDYDGHIQQLIASNETLNELANEEIEKLKQFIQSRTTGTITGSATLEEELYDAQIMVRVKDAELQKLRSQVKNLENSLQRSTEENRNTMTLYLQMMKKCKEIEKQQKQEPEKEVFDEMAPTPSVASRRALRRTPSFHQRARSPSPQTSTTPRKDSEHHSRDGHRRRHLQQKDLRRSKSSPSLPYVFDPKGLGGNVLSQGGATKTPKSPKP